MAETPDAIRELPKRKVHTSILYIVQYSTHQLAKFPNIRLFAPPRGLCWVGTSQEWRGGGGGLCSCLLSSVGEPFHLHIL
jgi:hypothetical protein